jgi:hypothetical protein
MKRILIIGVALLASTIALTASASARLGMAPLAVAGIITAGAIIAEPPFTGTRARHLIARARTNS